MEFTMREWLTVIIGLLIAGVLLDGWRRMRRSKQENIKMSLSMHKGINKSDIEGYGSELPNGGARVVEPRETDTDPTIGQARQHQAASNVEEPLRDPEQVTFNLDEEVPMLMESIESDPADEPTLASADELTEADLSATSAAAPKASKSDSDIRASDHKVSPKNGTASAADTQTEEVIIINVMATSGGRLQGSDLLQVLLECGMRYGDRQIFHRHLDEDGEGPLLFSMANMVVPGTFELSAMDAFETPGVSLFMSLPTEANSLDTFNLMAKTATTLAERLGGELKDENRSVMTMQTLEHCRQRIRDFERKRLSRG